MSTSQPECRHMVAALTPEQTCRSAPSPITPVKRLHSRPLYRASRLAHARVASCHNDIGLSAISVMGEAKIVPYVTELTTRLGRAKLSVL